MRIFRYRTLKFKPRIATTYRPHGKWGDLLICLIPVSWCINIISNSNFILRMIEWQAESSIFTLRIRGRQWYWIYKYDLKTITDLITVPKNIGHNRWQITTPGDLQTADDYLHILQLRLYNKWIKRYWSEFLDKTAKDSSFNIVSIPESKKFSIQQDSLALQNSQSQLAENFIDSTTYDQSMKYLYNHENFTEVTRWTKRTQGTISPCRLIKYPLDNENLTKNELLNRSTFELFRLRFNDANSTIIHKPISHNNYLVLKQKRYKPLKTAPIRVKFLRDSLTGVNTKIAKYSGKMTLVRNSIFLEDGLDSSLRYKLFKKFKKQTESVPLTLWKRLLRTKRTLVLPAHTNIATVTNSYDVVHSWFIPGLGLKMDCIPGRATHHVVHIDNVGFYYGQCAEICGRYHHHMPIRICALPFEHFLLWWQTYGLPKLISANTDQRRFTRDFVVRKYAW